MQFGSQPNSTDPIPPRVQRDNKLIAIGVIILGFLAGSSENITTGSLLALTIAAFYTLRWTGAFEDIKARMARIPHWIRTGLFLALLAFLWMIIFFVPCDQSPGGLACLYESYPTLPYSSALDIAFYSYPPDVLFNDVFEVVGTTLAWFMIGAIVGGIMDALGRADGPGSKFDSNYDPDGLSGPVPPSQDQNSK